MGKNRIQLVLWIIVGLLMGGCTGEIAEEVMLEGMKAMQSRPPNFIYALVQFDKFLGKYPQHELVPEVWFYKAQCHQALREATEALDACDKALATATGKRFEIEVQSVFLKTQILVSQGKWEQAANTCKMLMNRPGLPAPVFTNAWMRLADIYTQANQMPLALQTYADMIDSASIEETYKPGIQMMKGRLLADQNLTDQAIEAFAQLETMAPGSMDAFFGKVEIARLMKDSTPELSEQYINEVIAKIREMAVLPEDATEELRDATAPRGMPPGVPQIPLKDQARISGEMQIARVHTYLEDYDKAIEVLEKLKSDYQTQPLVVQETARFIEMIQQEKNRGQGVEVEGATQETMSVGAAAVGSVSP